MIELLTCALLLGGASFMLTAAVGVVRLPDVLCRAHAVAKALTLGVFLLLLGCWLHLEEKEADLKILLAIFFQGLTIPVASHLVALLALRKDIRRWRHRPMDDHRKGRGQ